MVIVTLILLIILVVPILCEKVHIPSIIGLIIAGALIGPHGLGWVDRSETISMLGQLGLLYLMFVSGIEISMSDLQKERFKGMVFGLYTFLMPGVLGFAAGFWVFGYSLPSSILLGSMLGSHTLITYPVVSRYNIQRNRAVSLIIAGTIVAVTAAMVFLAVIVATSQGANDALFWWRMGGGSVVMTAVIFYGIPRLAEWLFKRYNDSIVEYIFVMLMAAGSGVMAWLAGLEPVLGVFLAGMALNRHIPNLSPLMNKINFIGNAIFIPVFLLGVGMLVDFSAFVHGRSAIIVALLMPAASISGKWLAAWAAQHSFHLTKHERQLTFGLSNAKAAGSLAAVTIGYKVVLADGTRLLDENVLNGVVFMILIACAVSSFLTEHAAKRIALEDMQSEPASDKPQRILIPVSSPESSRLLVELATMILEKNDGSSLHAMGVIRHAEEQQQVEQQLEQIARFGAATDHRINLHTQVAVNISNGILNIANGEQITHIVAGMGGVEKEPGYGKVINPLLTTSGQGLWIYHPVQPLKTIKTVRILAPEHAEKESGYNEWRHMVGNIIRLTQSEVTQEVMSKWPVLPRIAGSMGENDLLIVVQARPSTISYHPDMEQTADVLQQFFTDRNYIVVFPQQNLGQQADNPFFSEFARHSESTFSMVERLQNKIRK